MAVFKVKGFNEDFEAITEALSAYDAKRKVLEDTTCPVEIVNTDINAWSAQVMLGSGTIEYRSTETDQGRRDTGFATYERLPA